MKWFLFVVAVFLISYIIFVPLQAKSAETLKSDAHKVFDMINERRREAGIAELIWSDNLASLSAAYSLEMSKTGIYEHSPGAGADYAECIMKSANPEGIYEAWIESPLHLKILMDKRLRIGAVGIGEINHSIEVGDYHYTYWIDTGYATFMADY
jgi:uncharacterized protein YkwD